MSEFRAEFGVWARAAAGTSIAHDGRMRSPSAVITSLLLAVFLSTPARAQTESNERNVRDLFAGQKMLVTWRDGGSLYGTFFTLQVHFCRSGRYMTFGESRRQTVMDNQQVSNLDDRGSWDVATFQGQLVVQVLVRLRPGQRRAGSRAAERQHLGGRGRDRDPPGRGAMPVD